MSTGTAAARRERSIDHQGFAAHRVSMSSSAAFAAERIGAQSQDVLGAYFPSWMFCALAALTVTAMIRWIFVKAGVDRSLPVPVVVYLALTVAFSLGGWLLWLG
jgi:YtcA family